MGKALKRMLIALAVIIGVLVIAIAPFLFLAPRAPKPPASLSTVAELDAYLTALTAHETPPALDIVVMKDGAVVYSKAFGIADGIDRKPAAADGIYHYWSVTKLFTATAIMQLVEAGKISLDDPVTRYLPEFTTVDPSDAATEISLRQLLDHTSGMKNLGPMDLIGWNPSCRRSAGRSGGSGPRPDGLLPETRREAGSRLGLQQCRLHRPRRNRRSGIGRALRGFRAHPHSGPARHGEHRLHLPG